MSIGERSKMKTDNRPVCTEAEPKPDMGLKARHPDAGMVYRNDDEFEDEKWRCPNCGYEWWKEGIDS